MRSLATIVGAMALACLFCVDAVVTDALAGQRTNFSRWQNLDNPTATRQPRRRVRPAQPAPADWRNTGPVRQRLRQPPGWQQPGVLPNRERRRSVLPPPQTTEERRTRRRARRIQRQDGLAVTERKPVRPKFFTYKPERLVPVRNRKLAGEIADDPLAKAVFQALKKGTKRPVRSEKEDRTAVIAFYQEREYRPLWIDEGGLNARGKDLLETLASAHEHGLSATRYLPPVMKSSTAVPDGLLAKPDGAAALDIALTVKALKFARHASGGQIRPDRIGPNHDIKTHAVAPADALKRLAEAERPRDYLDSLHPDHPLYAKLKAALNGNEKKPVRRKTVEIPVGRMLAPGARDPRISLLRTHLASLGFLKAGEGQAGDTYDAGLERAVRKFQAAKGLRQDGLVGRRTLAALNGKSKPRVKRRGPEFKRKLALNMERLRWLPRDLGARHVIVNQAAYQAQMIEQGRKIHQMRVIIGKPRHPTPIFSDEMETVVFNPYWYIPRSILPSKLRRGGRSLDRRGYEVLNWKGKRIRSSRVKWWRYNAKNLPYTVRQKPGPRNALGEIKFLFPNKHSVYMHDTPSRHLFRNKDRAYSHGCVRVQDPRKFAEVVLGWKSARVNSAVNAKKNRPVKLAEKLPVHMTYFTLWLDDDGDLAAHADIYGRDKALERALTATRIAWGGKQPGRKIAKKGKRKKKWKQSQLQ
ncbi:MAG: L,D-transpeptidase family protein [Pseudomonadota bacterium]